MLSFPIEKAQNKTFELYSEQWKQSMFLLNQDFKQETAFYYL